MAAAEDGVAADHAPVIVAVTGEDDRFEPVRRRAASLAASGQATVILYDVDAGGVFASPLPTDWSAEGERELAGEEAVGDRLGPTALDTAGRSAIAKQVRALRAAGVPAWGWLPSSAGREDLVVYATRQGAVLVLVPSDMPPADGASVRFEVVT